MRHGEYSGRAWMNVGRRCLECDKGAGQGGDRTRARMMWKTGKGGIIGRIFKRVPSFIILFAPEEDLRRYKYWAGCTLEKGGLQRLHFRATCAEGLLVVTQGDSLKVRVQRETQSKAQLIKIEHEH